MQFGSGASSNPNTRLAVEEAVRGALRLVTDAPDLLLAFASPHHLAGVEHLAARLSDATSVSGVSAGAVVEGVVAKEQELEGIPALTVWAATLPGADVAGARLRNHQTDDGMAVSGWRQPEAPVVSILLADPFSFPAAGFVDTLPIPVVGGLVHTGTNHQAMFLNGSIHSQGAVAVTFGGSIAVQVFVSQGCRAIGEPAVVGSVSGQKLLEIGGRTALEYLRATLDELNEMDRQMAKVGLQLGVVVDEYAGDYAAGDFLIRDLLGVDESDGSLLVGDRLQAGQTVQLHVRDPRTATDELRHRLVGSSGGGGALVFTCTSRGPSFFGHPDHDAGSVERSLHPDASAGMLSAGEIGPIEGKNRLLVHSVTVALLSEAESAAQD